MRYLFALLLTVFSFNLIFAQDKAEYQKKFVWDREKEFLAADFSKIKKPTLQDFKNDVFYFKPIRQDTTGTCWCFSAISFLESEIYRLHNNKIKLSEMYIIYWEYMEKARRFIREEGNSKFYQGSESNAVLERIKQYGLMPASAYSGLVNGHTKHNHDPLRKEMYEYLKFLNTNNYRDEKIALNTIKDILNKYMGEPPLNFEYGGETYTPDTFQDQIAKIRPDDYVGFMSTMRQPFYEKGEFKVPDNWWHSEEYHNVPLDVFYQAVKKAIDNDYSMVIGGDVSEPGRYGWEDFAIVVPWDIPAEHINQSSRELRIYNKTTGDDHGIHLVGSVHKYGHDWFLIKDSASSAHYGKNKGFYFFRDDFVKLKMLTFLVHKDAVKDILKKF